MRNFFKPLIEFGAGLGYRVWVEPSVAHGMRLVEKLQRKGGGAILNILGEHHDHTREVEADVKKYLELVEAIAQRKANAKKSTEAFNAAVSIKPTQFGFTVKDLPDHKRRTYAEQKMWEVVNEATQHNIPVEIDVESSDSHEFTYHVFKTFAERLTAQGRGGLLGVAVQANYPNSLELLRGLMTLDPKTHGSLKFRLVKGIYPRAKDQNAIDDEKKMLENYHALVDFALSNPQSPHQVALGSHREDILEKGIPHPSDEPALKVQLQMLKGIRVPLRMGLEKLGFAPWLYVPIGSRKSAGPYASRRLQKAAGLLYKTASDFFSPRVWTGRWLRLGRRGKKKSA